MTPLKSVSEVQNEVLALNGQDKPYMFKIDGNKIIGTWNIVDASWLGLLSANKINKNYSITFKFNELKSTYDFTETLSSFDRSTSPFGFLFNGSWSWGKMMERDYTWIPGVGLRNSNQPVATVGTISYSFDTSEIKKPVIAILNEAGWKPKNFMTKFYGR